jgi:hypothetical protein
VRGSISINKVNLTSYFVTVAKEFNRFLHSSSKKRFPLGQLLVIDEVVLPLGLILPASFPVRSVGGWGRRGERQMEPD